MVAIVQTATPATGSGSVSCAFSSAPTAGNKVIIAVATQHTGTDSRPSTPSGFVQTLTEGTGLGKVTVFHREAGASEPSSYSVSMSGGDNQLWGWEVSGLVDSDTIGDLVDASFAGGFASATSISMTVGPLDEAEVFLVGVVSPANTVGSQAMTNGFSVVQQDSRGFIGTRIDTSATSTSPTTNATWTTGRFGSAALIAFAAASAPPAPLGTVWRTASGGVLRGFTA